MIGNQYSTCLARWIRCHQMIIQRGIFIEKWGYSKDRSEMKLTIDVGIKHLYLRVEKECRCVLFSWFSTALFLIHDFCFFHQSVLQIVSKPSLEKLFKFSIDVISIKKKLVCFACLCELLVWALNVLLSVFNNGNYQIITNYNIDGEIPLRSLHRTWTVVDIIFQSSNKLSSKCQRGSTCLNPLMWSKMG